ncbi:hypothetical protein AAAX31_06295 [Collinsella sp. CLA-ER-H5]|uniref:hypothetical protein n=1 Tax=Collinsella sp. CLA-ER-H5 TaxID=3136222 RepID=UPI0032C13798
MNERHDDLQEIIDAALREMAAEEGDGFDPQACNLAEFCRRTGLTRSRARTVRAHGFRALPHGNSGRRAAPGVLAGHTGLVDDLLRRGVTNSQVIFERLLGQGYAGGLTTVKTYIAAHRDLVPARRRRAAPQGGRGQRFRTAPGEAYQMDWGFVAVERPGGERARIACFAMVCHHCGSAHVEFFPNARQENLLIGMLHAFSALGVPATVLTDNMKSVVVRHGSVVATDRAAAYVGVLAELEVAAHAAYDPKDRSEGTINRVNTVHSLLGAFMEPFKGVSTKHLDAYLAWFRWCRTFMATDSGTAECTVARQLTNGVCRSRIRDMFNVLPPYMDYWAEAAA